MCQYYETNNLFQDNIRTLSLAGQLLFPSFCGLTLKNKSKKNHSILWDTSCYFKHAFQMDRPNLLGVKNFPDKWTAMFFFRYVLNQHKIDAASSSGTTIVSK